ncbi:hypothetical protein JHD47_01620 [Sulfurimonas sp. SAG-AH-194-L11]|nr:hypothetical protein [Sulfurimonas sp. SAG-AH-194-L11]MDF1876514.1 hypothetical protein [Sulfurimonas sp. SAG-AH-194-L11]
MTKALITDIVLIDIINFSQLTSAQQLEIVVFLTKSFKKMIEKMLYNSNTPLSKFIIGYVSTGDGFYCILNPRLKGFGPILGLSFNHFSEHISKKYDYFEGIRIAAHTGEVNEFEDILGSKNFIGDGLNDCARYLEIKNFAISTVMVSDAAYESLRNFLTLHKDFNTLLTKRELKKSTVQHFKDKHGNKKEGCLIWLRKSGIINPPNINYNSII